MCCAIRATTQPASGSRCGRQIVIAVHNRLAIAAPDPPKATGCAGVRERAAAVGGHARCGPDADGWTVRAELPRSRPRVMTIRVGIADDQPMIRDGFRLQVQFAADLEFVGAAADGEQAVALARSANARTCC